MAIAVDVSGPEALVCVDFDRALAGLPAPAILVEHAPDPGGLALNTVNDVGQPVFVHVGQRHGAHIPLHRQGLGLGQAAGPVAIADGDRTGFTGAGHHVEVTVVVQVGTDEPSPDPRDAPGRTAPHRNIGEAALQVARQQLGRQRTDGESQRLRQREQKSDCNQMPNRNHSS